jgi:hypothetical protein
MATVHAEAPVTTSDVLFSKTLEKAIHAKERTLPRTARIVVLREARESVWKTDRSPDVERTVELTGRAIPGEFADRFVLLDWDQIAKLRNRWGVFRYVVLSVSFSGQDKASVDLDVHPWADVDCPGRSFVYRKRSRGWFLTESYEHEC